LSSWMLDPLHSVVRLASYGVTSNSYRTPQLLKPTCILWYPPSKRQVLVTKRMTMPGEYFQPSASREPRESVLSVLYTENWRSSDVHSERGERIDTALPLNCKIDLL
jgi:hypothetical protein